MKCYTYGVFDLLHTGHIKLLEQAKALGDYLIVGVFTDKVAESFKRKPIIPLEQRIEMLRALKIVDKVLPLKRLLPNWDDLEPEVKIIAKAEGAGWDKNYQPKWDGIKSVLLEYTKGVSTSGIIKKIQSYACDK